MLRSLRQRIDNACARAIPGNDSGGAVAELVGIEGVVSKVQPRRLSHETGRWLSGGDHRCHRSPPRPPIALAARDVRSDEDGDAARSAEHPRRPDDRVADRAPRVDLSAADACGRRADRRPLLAGTDTPGAQGIVRWRGGQGYGEPRGLKLKSDWDAWNAHWLAVEADCAADLRRYRGAAAHGS
jgi:hypothetical protein